jgi:hypothetical protein
MLSGEVNVSMGAERDRIGFALLSEEISSPQSGNPETGLVPKATCGNAPKAPVTINQNQFQINIIFTPVNPIYKTSLK